MNDTRSTHIDRAAAVAGPAPFAVDPLHDEYAHWQALFAAQPGLVQRYLESQGRLIAEALANKQAGSQLRFSLPDRVVIAPRPGRVGQVAVLPAEFREQLAGGLIDRLTRANLAIAVRLRLGELEQSPNQAVAISAGLLRFTAAQHLVRGLLPSGHTVAYTAAPGEAIPTLPVTTEQDLDSAVTGAGDAIAEEGAGEAGRGELLVPFVPSARQFYLPQWVAFDAQGRMLVHSISEAEAHVSSMQHFLAVLHTAISLASYIVADEVYQQKRYGMLGQLVNQGRALARYRTQEIVQTIWRRAKSQDLNRGLSVSLPYFDDQDLRLRTHSFEIIPVGRILFVPAFVVHSALAEQAKVAQDTRLSVSTRQHLLSELHVLEMAFALPAGQ